MHGWKSQESYRNNEYDDDDDFQPSYGRTEVKHIQAPNLSKFRQTEEFIVSEYGRNNPYNDYPKHPGTSTSVDIEYDAYPNTFFNRRPFLARNSKDNKNDESSRITVVANIKQQPHPFVGQSIHHGNKKFNNNLSNNFIHNCPVNNKNCNRIYRSKADYASYFRPVIKRISTATAAAAPTSTTKTSDEHNNSGDNDQKVASSQMVQSLLSNSKIGYYPVYAYTNKNYIRV